MDGTKRAPVCVLCSIRGHTALNLNVLRCFGRLWHLECALLFMLLLVPRLMPRRLVGALENGPLLARALGWPALALHRASLIAPMWYSQVRSQHIPVRAHVIHQS